ncbi:MAG TPA: heme-binding domain-containing protein [Candidatus Limnocylindrales bacterium]
MTAEPPWDSPQTRALAVRACFDCHSNETIWPSYTNLAPISWRTQQHVDEGRSKLNFSTWGTGRQRVDKVGDQITSGAMPPLDYLLVHPEARLSDGEKTQLIDGLKASLRDGG